MKKLILALLTTFLVATGLVAFAGSAAQAACPYTGCVQTTVSITKIPYDKFPNNRKYNAQVEAGNTSPQGSIRFRLVKGNDSAGKAIKQVTKDAPSANFNTDHQKNGTYTLQVCYIKAPNSVWSNSCDTRTFTFS